MPQVANALAASIAFACVAWLLWPAVRERPPSLAYAVVAGLGTGLVGTAVLAAFGPRWDLAVAAVLLFGTLDLAGLAACGRPLPATGASPSARSAGSTARRPGPGAAGASGRRRCR
jgi:multidrug transporter EmrE-like cation transporter